MYAVVVTFQIAEGHMLDFLPLMASNASSSLALEPECHQFDVCTDSATPNEVFLYERYTDRAAFDAHLASDHFKTFDAKVGAMILSKSVHTYDQVSS